MLKSELYNKKVDGWIVKHEDRQTVQNDNYQIIQTLNF